MEANVTTEYDVILGNFTLSDEEKARTEVFKALVAAIMGVLMFGMGCAVEHERLLESFKRPVGLAVGLICQIFLMPLFAYSLIKISAMSKLQSLAFMLVGCSPGGSTSNIVTYLLEGDMSLSVAMTTISNLIALGSVPAWLALFTYIEDIEDNLQIPYSSLGISLASLIIPIVLGILFRYKFPKQAARLPRFCAIFGFIFLTIIIVAMLIVNQIPIIFSASTFMPPAILPLAGMLISFLVSCIPQLKLEMPTRKAIAIETAVQNGGLTNTVILMSYGTQIHLLVQVLTIPLLYSITQMSYNIIIVFVYRIVLCRQRRLSPNSSQKSNDHSIAMTESYTRLERQADDDSESI